MAQVVQRVTTSTDPTIGFFNWLIAYWWVWVLALVIIILGIVIWVILAKWEEERKERDDTIYQAYKNLLRDTELNRDKKKIQKGWSPINLLWLGLPLVKTEHSAKIINYTNELIGYYRGHLYTQDGYLNILAYKEKFFIFFEKRFLIRCPLFVKFNFQKKDEKGKLIEDEDGKLKTGFKILDYRKWVFWIHRRDLKLIAYGLEKHSYFRYPVYLESTGQMIDLRKETGEDLMEISYNELNSRILSDGARAVEKAMEHNPNVVYEQKIPEKTSTEKKDEDT